MTATTEPSRVTAGDTITWLKSLPDYPANAGWVLGYTLINQAGKHTITATASGADHLVSVPAATSATWPAGLYTWVSSVSKGADRYTLDTGNLTVSPDLAAAVAGLDTRSHARKTLAAVEAYLENPNNLSASMYEIAGRKLQRFDIPALLVLRSRYQMDVAREDSAARLGAGLAPLNQIRVRFGPR